jgi:hypothetical protein
MDAGQQNILLENTNWRSLQRMVRGVSGWHRMLEAPGKNLPQGRMPNIKTDTREDELLTREKILMLRLCAYLEAGLIKLAIPWFTVPKAGDDVSVVWDSKANGYNACLWAPGFLLGDSGDLKEIVFKWLSKPVGIYLLEGSPDEDHSQDASTFIKSQQEDIDVGQQFNNYRAHVNDRPYLGVRMIDTRNDGSQEKCFALWRAVFTLHRECLPAEDFGALQGASSRPKVTFWFGESAFKHSYLTQLGSIFASGSTAQKGSGDGITGGKLCR